MKSNLNSTSRSRTGTANDLTTQPQTKSLQPRQDGELGHHDTRLICLKFHSLRPSRGHSTLAIGPLISVDESAVVSIQSTILFPNAVPRTRPYSYPRGSQFQLSSSIPVLPARKFHGQIHALPRHYALVYEGVYEAKSRERVGQADNP